MGLLQANWGGPSTLTELHVCRHTEQQVSPLLRLSGFLGADQPSKNIYGNSLRNKGCLTETVCKYLAPCCSFVSWRQRNCYHMQWSTRENSILKRVTGPCVSYASSLLSVNDVVGLSQIWCWVFLIHICMYQIQVLRGTSTLLYRTEFQKLLYYRLLQRSNCMG